MQPENALYVVGSAEQTQGDVQLAAEQGVAGQLHQRVSYVPVMQQQALGAPYAAAIPGQQQQQLYQQGGVGSGFSSSPSFMLAQPPGYSSGSHISQQQTPDTSTEMNTATGQPGTLPAPEVVQQPPYPGQYVPQGSYQRIATQQPFIASPSEHRYQGQPAGQVLIGYPPVQGYGAPQGVVMVRPGPQRGATVAVIPAGPSTWSQVGAGLSAAAGDAPNLEDICAAMAQLAVPPPAGANPELPLQQQYAAAGGHAQQQIQVMGQQPLQQQPMQLQLGQQQQQVPVYVAAPPVGQQQVQLVGGLQQRAVPQLVQQQQLLPGQPVVVLMSPDGNPGAAAHNTGTWGSMGPGM